MESIPESERASSVLDLDLDKERLPVERTLGLRWDMQKDTFIFDTTLKSKPNTHRGMLSLASSIYDPLGFLAPIILPAKKLLQDLCKQRLDWDDPVGENKRRRWEKWKEDLPKLSRLAVKRCVKPADLGKLKFATLHNFADVSQFALGAVSYLRMVDLTDNAYCSFLMGKSRLAHIKPMTVPRLELSAAVLAVQVDEILRSELEIPLHQSVFWMDSTTVLQYIRNESARFHTFVSNRLTVIHEHSEPCQWRYVNSELNPADEASRGLTVDTMIQNSRWLTGPEFLTKEEHLWHRDLTCHQTKPDDPELKRDVQMYIQTTLSQPEEDALTKLLHRFSSWDKLKKAFAWLLRFENWFVQKYRHLSGNNSPFMSLIPRGELLVNEVQVAESEVTKHLQKLSFPKVVEALQRVTRNLESSGQVKPGLRKLKIATSLCKLNPVLDGEGILRLGGRLENGDVSYDAKHQIILPYRHHVTNLIIQKYHITELCPLKHVDRTCKLSSKKVNRACVTRCRDAERCQSLKS